MNYLWWILIGGVILLIILAILFFTKSNSNPIVTLYTTNITSTTVDLEWTSSKSTDTDTFDVYQDNDDVDDDEIFSGITGNNYKITNLSPNTQYSFYVILNNNYKSNTKTITTTNNSTLTATNQSNTVTLVWEPVDDASDYTLFRTVNQIPTEIPGITGTTYTDNDLIPNNTYIYYLIAYSSDNISSGPSNEVEITITLQAPILTLLGTTDTTVDLSWNDNSIISYYKIYRDDIVIEQVDGDITDYKDDNLTPHTEYKYKIVAYFDDDVFTESTIITVTTNLETPFLTSDTAQPQLPPTLTEWMEFFDNEQRFIEDETYENPSPYFKDLTIDIQKAGVNTTDLYVVLGGKDEDGESVHIEATFTETTVIPSPNGNLYAITKAPFPTYPYDEYLVGELDIEKVMSTNEYKVILKAVGWDELTEEPIWRTFVFK